MSQKCLFPAGVLDEDRIEQMLAPLYPLLWKMIREPFDDLAHRRVMGLDVLVGCCGAFSVAAFLR